MGKDRILHQTRPECANGKVNRLIQDHAEEVGGDGSNYYMAQVREKCLGDFLTSVLKSGLDSETRWLADCWAKVLHLLVMKDATEAADQYSY